MMLIRFACRRCRTFLEISFKLAGNPVHCPVCRNELIVPSSSDPLPASRPAPVGIPEPAAPLPVPAIAMAEAPKPSTPPRTNRRRLLVRAALTATVLLALAAVDWLLTPRPATPQPEAAVAQTTPPASQPARLHKLNFVLGEQEEQRTVPSKGHQASLQPRLVPAALSGEMHGHLIAGLSPEQPRTSQGAGLQARELKTEEELRRVLIDVPEVSLDRRDFDVVVNAYYASQRQSQQSGTHRYDPTYLSQVYPNVRTLPMRYGNSCRLDHGAASRLDTLSRKLRINLARFAPVGADHHRTGLGLLRAQLRAEMHGKNPEWLRAGAIPALMQQLMAEETPVRHLLVDLLSEIQDRQASIALAKRAVFDLSRDVRARAIEALQNRPRDDYRWVFLKALRYPWAPAARHASEALIALRDYQAIPLLISLLDKPNPAAPFRIGKRHVVREMVRTNHLANCLLCHPPSVTYRDPVPGVVPAVTWQFPVPGQRQANQLTSSINSLTGQLTSTGTTIQTGCHNYSATSSTSAVTIRTGQQQVTVNRTITVVRNAAGRPLLVMTPTLSLIRQPTPTANRVANPGRQPSFVRLPLLVRGDITYLRQDFSVLQPVAQPVGPSPLDMRFDYMLRTRTISAKEARLISESCNNTHYEQRQAVLTTLRGLTGENPGDTTSAWRRLVPRAESEAHAMQLSDQAIEAKPAQRHQVLRELRDGKGLAYTDALARTVARLHGDARMDARDLLAHRLTRMSAATLQAKLHDDDAEVRRAAALACALKHASEHVPDLIEMLDDPDPGAAFAAHEALKELSGRDYGPGDSASPDDHLQAVAAWRGWSEQQGRLSQ